MEDLAAGTSSTSTSELDKPEDAVEKEGRGQLERATNTNTFSMYSNPGKLQGKCPIEQLPKWYGLTSFLGGGWELRKW